MATCPPTRALLTINEDSGGGEDDDVIVVSAAQARNKDDISSDDGVDDNSEAHDDDDYDDDNNTNDSKLPAKTNYDNFRPCIAKQSVHYTSDCDAEDIADARDSTYGYRGNDDDIDEYANMLDLDLSDNDVIEKKTAGRKRSKGWPPVPAKGSVSSEEYRVAVKKRKQYNDAGTSAPLHLYTSSALHLYTSTPPQHL